MLDLYNQKYDEEILKSHIYQLKFMDIIKTQILDVTFIVKYILNDKYQLHEEDQITIEDIIKYQPHISEGTLLKCLHEYNSEDDSVVNFETYSENISDN